MSTVPQGIQCTKPDQVCKLIITVYGLKQTSRKWYEKHINILLKLGYSQSNSDYSMFTLIRGNHIIVLLVYVYDVILVGTSLHEFDRVKQVLHRAFKIKDLGKSKYFLRLEVAHLNEGIVISLRKYCLDLLKKYMFACIKAW